MLLFHNCDVSSFPKIAIDDNDDVIRKLYLFNAEMYYL